MAYQSVYGYFMPRGKGIAFIVRLYLHSLKSYFLINVFSCIFFAHGPIVYEYFSTWSIWSPNWIWIGSITPSPCEHENKVNEEVFHTLQISRTEFSQSIKVEGEYLILQEIQSVYSKPTLEKASSEWSNSQSSLNYFAFPRLHRAQPYHYSFLKQCNC